MGKHIKENTKIQGSAAPSEGFDGEQISGCSFTGHRTVQTAHRDEVADRLTRAVVYAYERGCRKFYCGGALGFDTLAAREVIRFSLTHPTAELHLVLPCVDQTAKWTERQRSDYEYIFKRAVSVEYVSEDYTPTCMKERNTRLAELGDIVIAYLYRRPSGTAQTVRIAKELGKEVFNIAPGGVED